jgi:hydrogenase expression/formation protein HypC
MCLGIPGRVVRWLDRDSILASAEVEFAGICRVCQMACVPDASEGDYVIVHAGVAISRMDREAAERTLNEFSRLGEDGGWSPEGAP